MLMVEVTLVNPKNGKAVKIGKTVCRDEAVFTTNCARFYGSFKSATRTSAGTTIVSEPDGNGAIVLTDLIVATDKVNNATVTVQFNDGTHQIVLLTAHVTDAPCNLAIPFTGHFQGWQAARLEVVTVGNVKTTVSCGYYKISQETALPYDTWNAKR